MIEQINQHTTIFITIASSIVLGIFAIANLIDKQSKARRVENDEADTKLINILKTTVDTLEKKVSSLEEETTINRREVAKLKSENELLTKIFQGRDADSQETLRLARQTNEYVVRLCSLMEQHLSAIERVSKK